MWNLWEMKHQAQKTSKASDADNKFISAIQQFGATVISYFNNSQKHFDGDLKKIRWIVFDVDFF